MSRFILAAFAFMVLFSMASAAECQPDEVYKECGTACPPTCDNPDPQGCTKQCVAGCFCRDGLVRDSKGRCIRLSKCPGES